MRDMFWEQEQWNQSIENVGIPFSNRIVGMKAQLTSPEIQNVVLTSIAYAVRWPVKPP